MKEIDIKNLSYISEVNNIVVELFHSIRYHLLSESVYYKINLCVRSKNWDLFWIKIRDQVDEKN
jgi:hypothetical protein